MKNGNTREFLECIDHQEATLRCRGRHFFVNGCSVEVDRKTGHITSASLEVSEVDGEDFSRAVRWIASITKPSVQECVEEFCRTPLIDGKTFWELENELEWV